jgi:hypothetical protein
MEPTNDHIALFFLILWVMANRLVAGSFQRNTDVFQLLNAIPAIYVLAAGTYAKTRFALARP